MTQYEITVLNNLMWQKSWGEHIVRSRSIRKVGRQNG